MTRKRPLVASSCPASDANSAWPECWHSLKPARCSVDSGAAAMILEVSFMAGNSVNRESDDLGIRINELGTKSTQLLLFLTFAILGAATLRTAESPADQALVPVATWWWILAVFPA